MRHKRVLVSVTYSKSTIVEVPDHYTDKDLRDAARVQCHLPKEIIEPLAEVARVKPHVVYPNFKPEVFEGWEEDDFEVVEE